MPDGGGTLATTRSAGYQLQRPMFLMKMLLFVTLWLNWAIPRSRVCTLLRSYSLVFSVDTKEKLHLTWFDWTLLTRTCKETGGDIVNRKLRFSRLDFSCYPNCRHRSEETVHPIKLNTALYSPQVLINYHASMFKLYYIFRFLMVHRFRTYRRSYNFRHSLKYNPGKPGAPGNSTCSALVGIWRGPTCVHL